MNRPAMLWCLARLGLTVLAAGSLWGQSRAPLAEPCALTHVRMAGSAAEAPLKTLLLKDGRIEAVLSDDAQVPANYRLFDGTGLVAAPGFVDAFSQRGVVAPMIVPDRDRPVDTGDSVLTDMRAALRKGVRPTFRTADGLGLGDEDAKSMREYGFGSLLAAPQGELIAGQSAVLLARDAAGRDQVILPVVWQHAAFKASGDGYPSTLMGYMAVLRQLFLDAGRHAVLQQRAAERAPGPRPPHDPDLEALMPVLGGKQLLACEAQTDRDIRRWLRLADEFDLSLAIMGGRDAWQTIDRLQAAKVAVILTLDWGVEAKDPSKPDEDEDKDDSVEDEDEDEDEDDEDDEDDSVTDPSEDPAGDSAGDSAEGKGEEASADPAAPVLDFDYSEPEGVTLEKRRTWEERRDCAMRLAEAGVPFAFGSGGDSPKQLLKRVRTLVDEGLAPDVALAALTSQAAEILGLQGELGSLEPGANATLCLWTGDPLDGKSQVRWAFVDGFRYEYEAKPAKEGEGPAKGVDLGGEWTLTYLDAEGESPMYLSLEMGEDGSVSGEVKATNPQDQSTMSADADGLVDGESFELTMTFNVGDIEVRVSLDGSWDDGELEGTQTLRFGGQEVENKFVAEKTPKRRMWNEIRNRAAGEQVKEKVQR